MEEYQQGKGTTSQNTKDTIQTEMYNDDGMCKSGDSRYISWPTLSYAQKNGETKTIEMDEAGSTEHEATMLSEKYSNSKKLSPF